MEIIENTIEKKELYELMCLQLQALIEPELPLVTNLSNASALINEALKQINWAGFYLLNEDQLILGPFQGKVACVKIRLGQGVCGIAAKEARTQLVDDVHKFSGHIPCDSASNSEVVVPIQFQGKTVGVLDIDSPEFSRFDSQDQKGLEAVVHILENQCNWSMQIV
ncbi:MAG: GAF domain-containing protein [Lachnotalea sp.]